MSKLQFNQNKILKLQHLLIGKINLEDSTVGVGAIAGIGATYCGSAGNAYGEAYNYFSLKKQSSKTKYKMETISFLGVIVCSAQTGVKHRNEEDKAGSPLDLDNG